MTLRNIVWQAYDLFCQPPAVQVLENSLFSRKLTTIANLMSALRPGDIGLTPEKTERLSNQGTDPVWYMSIVDAESDAMLGKNSSGDDESATSEDEHPAKNTPNPTRLPRDPATVMTVAAFLLKPGARLPLHDHPKMYGILKVLQGSVSLQAYSSVRCLVAPSGHSIPQLLVEKYEVVEVTPDSAPLVLHKNSQDVHEITNNTDSMSVFLDILTPPYDFRLPDDTDTEHAHRYITYYREVGPASSASGSGESSDRNKSLVILEEVPCPGWYTTAHLKYTGRPLHESDTASASQ